VKGGKSAFELKPGVFIGIPKKFLNEEVQELFDSPVVGQIQYMWEKKGKLSGHVQLF
jgi:hypothetical protein